MESVPLCKKLKRVLAFSGIGVYYALESTALWYHHILSCFDSIKLKHEDLILILIILILIRAVLLSLLISNVGQHFKN